MNHFNRRKFWFGTEERMQYILVPNSGADMGSEGWSASGTTLNGLGYGYHSRGSHKTYAFEWPESSTREDARLMQSYYEGTYGRGLTYFLDPLIYDQNVLPARWADPSIALDDEGSGLVYGVTPTAVTPTDLLANDLPILSARYDLTNVTPGFRGKGEAVFIPVPPGKTLLMGAVYTRTGTGAVYVSPVNSGVIGSPVSLVASDDDADNLLLNEFTDVSGVWLWLGKTATGSASVTVRGLIARIAEYKEYPPLPPGDDPLYGEGGFGEGLYGGLDSDSGYGYAEGGYGATPYAGVYPLDPKFYQGPWIGGMGHSGCRFLQPPTYVANTGVDGGQIGFAASFIEVNALYGG